MPDAIDGEPDPYLPVVPPCCRSHCRPFSVISQILRGVCWNYASMIWLRIRPFSRKLLRAHCAVVTLVTQMTLVTFVGRGVPMLSRAVLALVLPFAPFVG